MALRDLQTNLKSLRVDKDRPFGGSSGLPYIKGGLPEDSPAGEYIADLARYSSDGTVRGGLFSVVSSTEDTIRISRFLNDFPKGLLFTSKQVGLQKSNPKIETGTRGDALNTQVYNLNSNLLAQIALQGTGVHVPRPGFNVNNLLNDENKYEKIVSNKRTDENRLVILYNNKILPSSISSFYENNLEKLGISSLDNELFNYAGGPGSSYGDGDTIISRAVNTNESWEIYKTIGYSTTGYFPKDTLTSQNPDNPENYQSLASDKFNSILRKKFPRKFTTNQITEGFNTNLNLNGNEGNDTGETIDVFIKQENLQFGYLDNLLENVDTSAQQGGTQISGDYIRPEQIPAGMPISNQFGNTMAYSKLLSSPQYNNTLNTIQDFRQNTIISSSLASDYSNPQVNITSRIGIGSPGGRTNNQRKSINTVYKEGQDKVNMIPLYNDATNPFENTTYKDQARDIIKFAFETIDNDGGIGDTGKFNSKEKPIRDYKTTKVHFRAFITNFSDNIGAEWSGQKYMGRGENFYTYQGFTREVSFNLKVAAQSKQEMLVLYQKLNYLASSLLPDYNSDGFMRGNLHQLTVGEWFYRTPGILKSMNISIDDNYPWEIKYTEPETEKDKQTKKDLGGAYFPNANGWNGVSDFENSNSDADQMELPQILDIQFSFIPILNELPALSKYDPDIKRIDKRGILISNDVGRTENFINRISDKKFQLPPVKIDTDDTFVPSVDGIK
jgi:hypothetical protein